jgi:tripartite-type tricarboxylate transporter receptor subunit TctC
MKFMITRLLARLCAAFCVLPVVVHAAEQPYPTRPIRLIVASSPGGPNDLAARMLATPWGEQLGRVIVIDNRAGAAGIIGTELVARAAPDGYTLLVGFPGPLIIAPLLNASSPYDASKDFAPISLAVAAPFVLVAHPGFPARSVSELIALARARPGKINYASGGTGIGSHLAMELLNHVTNTKMVHVPYKGAGPGLTALLAGEVEVMFVALGSALPHIKTEKVRALALGGEKRSPLVPNVPTINESGQRVNASSWYGMLAPRNSPRPVIKRLYDTLMQTLEAPQTKTRLTDMAFEVIASTPDDFAKVIREETATWRQVITAAGLKGN